MNIEKQIKYAGKVLSALQTLFDEESENYIGLDELREGDNMSDFIRVLATSAPQHIYIKFTEEEIDPLDFNYIANRLIVQTELSK
ncbi:hypothetical protein FUA48_16205 [Flavobacterium alkalisoli]|uniref:Uncharacterized protein n=1 Tax=Flavobacterium alkalisoli TaxID=2602769 RepID=A0A5B9FUR2_9FLAO|nr:hypothetical protein [Flavobacterium alkalisoli]QEE51063.1 hypothetical protein FUA48_16205 [Flavobacterium alkalisoli]